MPKPTGNTARDIQILYDSLDKLSKSVNAPQQYGAFGDTGKVGDMRFVMGKDNYPYFEAKGREDWFTTFQGVFQLKGQGSPYPHIPNLTVDNLYAKTFTVNQTNAVNGNFIMSDYGVVESYTATTITFVDQTNLGLCSFAVNDKCEVRRIKADKSADIRLVQFTVTAVSGRTITVTYTSSDLVAKGDIVVRKGNSSDSTRQASIYFSTTDTDNPYIDLYAGTTGFTYGTPKVAIGDLTHIIDSDFNPTPPYHLSGTGFYGDNVYLKGKLKITSNSDIIGLTFPTATYTSGATFPVSPVEADWHYLTVAIPPTYTTLGWYRYSGSAWVFYGVATTYIDGTGIYTGTIVATQITAGTLTGFTIQSNANTTNKILISLNEIKAIGYTVNDYLELGFSSVPYIQFNSDIAGGASGFITTAGINVSHGSTAYGLQIASPGNLLLQGTLVTIGGIYMDDNLFQVDSSGNITHLSGKVIDSPSSGYLHYNGTKFVWDSPMVYPGDGIVTAAAGAWGTSITDNSSNWNTAYGWGNHASAGYVTASAFSNTTNASNLMTTAYNLAATTSTIMQTWENWVNTSVIQYKDWDGNNQSITVAVPAP